jgi:transcriptional regulator NrdR family protein
MLKIFFNLCKSFQTKEDSIDKTLLEDHIKDQDKLRLLRTLESALKYAEISEERVDFRISESLTIGLSTKTNDDLFINEEKVSKETTLENLFSSPIIPIVNKNFFPLIKEVASNLDKFVELDVVKHISNLTNPFMESFAFNFKDNVYLYTCDERYGNSFYKYESAMELIDDVKNNMSYDLTYFYEDKLSDEVKVKRKLEDGVRQIEVDIDNIDRNIDKVETNLTMLGESKTLTEALKGLKSERKSLVSSLDATKETMYREVIKK